MREATKKRYADLIAKALDANPVPGDPNYGSSGGEYPFHGGGFTLNSTYDWWVQAFQ